jgi:membrane-bound serine protease (ClpP class)
VLRLAARRVGLAGLVAGGLAAVLVAAGGLPAGANTSRAVLGATSSHLGANPNLAFILFVLGLAGMCFELTHPGLNLPGVLGLISFVVSLVLLGRLPVDAAGIILLVLAFVFFIVEIKTGARSIAGLAGVASLVLGGLFLYDPSVHDARVSLFLLIPIAVMLGLFFIVVAHLALKARNLPIVTGADTLIGEEGVVTQALHPAGQVRVRGEVWAATFDDPKAKAPVGTKIVVSDLRGLTLYVAPIGPIGPIRGESKSGSAAGEVTA